MKDSATPHDDSGLTVKEPHRSNGAAPVQPSTNAEAELISGENVETAAAGSGGATQHRVDTGGRSAFYVGAGILISRIVGLIRPRIFAHLFGTFRGGRAGDAFTAAFRIPNFLQNVFGEGALSASFIPVYSKLLAQGDEKEARHVANAIFGLLALVTAVVVLFGVLGAPLIVTLIAAGF